LGISIAFVLLTLVFSLSDERIDNENDDEPSDYFYHVRNMKMGRILVIIGLLVTSASMGRWAYDCYRFGETVYYTKTSKIIVTTAVDPLFGTPVESTTTEPGYWLGLLDAEFPFGALPIAGAGVAIAITGVVLSRQRRKKLTTS